jgi:hypothetical protein
LHEDSRTKVVLRVPPVGGASALTARTKNALIKTVQKLAFFNGLEVFFGLKISSELFTLQERINALVLGIEMRHINNEILEDEHEHKW